MKKKNILLITLMFIFMSLIVTGETLVYEENFNNLSDWKNIGTNAWTTSGGIAICNNDECGIEHSLTTPLTNWEIKCEN